MQPEAQKPTLEYLANEILHVYDDEAAALGELEEETRARRERFREAKATLERTAAEAAEAIAEMDGLGSRLAQADLEGDEDGKDGIRGRHAALKASVKGIEDERREALDLFKHGDAWQTASAAYQTASARAEAVMRRAEEQRTELREALEKAFRDLDEKADRVRQFAKIHNTSRR